MATGQDLYITANGGAEAGAEIEDGLVEEKPTTECIPMGENKLKYINNNYEKVNARMYDHKCDVKISVGKSMFKGHRKVLSDASDYFSAMFSHEMKEKDEFLIELKEISPDGFGAMLDYFYHGNVTVEPKTVLDILEAARFFHVDWILDVCCDFMIQHLSLIDYATVMELADKFSLGDLRWEIFKFFGNNLPVLLEKETFLRDLSEELLEQFLMEGLYLEIPEFNLVELIVNWVKVDNDKRKEHLLPLLRQIRFYTMELEELEELPEEVTQIKEISEEVQGAKDYCLNVAAQCLKTGEKYLARGSKPTIMVSAFNDAEETNIVVYKDPYDDQSNLFVEQLGPTGFALQYNSANQAQIGNFLYAVGGYDGEYSSSDRVFRYDPKDREWTEMATMSKSRVSFGMCSSKDRLYVVGGVAHTVGSEADETILQAGEMYNPEENEWKPLADLPHGLFDHAAAYNNNTLFVSGGMSSDSSHPVPVNFVYSLNLGSSEWTKLPPLQTARQGHNMMALNNKLYILGGYTNKESGPGFKDCMDNELYDIETKQWSMLAKTPECCGHLYRHMGLIDSKIYFLCNQDSDIYLGHYDAEENKFEEPCILVGQGVHKVAVLQIAYPNTS